MARICFVLGDRTLLLLDLLIELQNQEIGGGDIGYDLQVAGPPVSLGRVELGRLSLNTLLRLAPHIECPS